MRAVPNGVIGRRTFVSEVRKLRTVHRVIERSDFGSS
jgi:hypothetical protein